MVEAGVLLVGRSDFHRFLPTMSVAEIGARLVDLGDVACRCSNDDFRREVLDYMLDIAKVAVSPLKKVYDSTKPSEEIGLREVGTTWRLRRRSGGRSPPQGLGGR